MPHDRIRNLFSEYLEGSLSDEDRRNLESHLGACADCSLLIRQLRGVLEDLHGFPRLEVPSGFTSRILEKTTLLDRAPGPWETLWFWLGLPRITPAAATALLVLPLFFIAGTRAGRQVSRETSMAVHQTYSNALRLYSRRAELGETAVEVGKRIPGQLEETMEWIRKRIETGGPEKSPQARPGEPGRQSILSPERAATA